MTKQDVQAKMQQIKQLIEELLSTDAEILAEVQEEASENNTLCFMSLSMDLESVWGKAVDGMGENQDA